MGRMAEDEHMGQGKQDMHSPGHKGYYENDHIPELVVHNNFPGAPINDETFSRKIRILG